MPERICLFPIDESSLYIIRNEEKMKKYELVYGIVPKGWNIEESSLENHRIVGEEQFIQNELINNVDTIVLCNSEYITKDTIYRQFIHMVHQAGKRVVATRELVAKFKELEEIEQIKGPEWDTSYLYEEVTIDKPIIMVAGAGENCEKSEVQLQLADFFEKQGYRPSLIQSNSIGKLFDTYLLPEFIWNDEIAFKNKVKQLLTYVKNIEKTDNPDVIIIGVPGASTKFNKYIDCGYGYLQYLLFTAIRPDAMILSLFCGDYSEEQYELLKNIYKFRFNSDVKYFHISKNVCDYDPELNKLSYFTVDTPYLVEHFLSKEKKIFHVQDETSRNVVFNDIMEELQNNITVL